MPLILLLNILRVHKILYMSQDPAEGTFWQQKSIVRYLQIKKDLSIVNKNRNFEDIIFTKDKDMSV